jgi:hypothetical protein
MRTGAFAIGLAVVLAGCGGSSSPEAQPSSQTTAPAAASTTVAAAVTTPTTAAATATGSGSACRYVTTAQASALAMSPVKAGVGRSLPSGAITFDYCDYIFDPGNSPGVLVAVANLGSGAAGLFAQFKQSKLSESDHQVVAGVGDEAFFAGQNLNVRKGDKGVILFVGRATGFPRGAGALPDEKRLAELVLPQL